MKKRLISYLLATILISSFAVSNSTVFAINDFYAQNDILFYDPSDTGCISGSSSIYTSPNSKDNQETTAKFLTSTNFLGNGDKPMNAVQMAAVMGNIQQESGFNPNSGEGGTHKGIIQWSSGRWNQITDPKTDFVNQLNFIKTELDGSYKSNLDEFWNAAASGDLDKATYAITRNYEVAYNEGKENSSTLWANDTDATNNVQDWIKRKDYAHTAYNDFGNLAGSGYTPGSGCGGGELVSGGMSLEKAKSFMNEYKSLTPTDWPSGTLGTAYDINSTDCTGGSLANCVAFSQYFINRYTTKKATGLPDGKDVVKRLLALGFVDGGHIPKIYSIFSQSGGDKNHTGVVLGIDIASNKIIIGEAGCGQLLDWTDAREKSLSEFSSNAYTYAYTDDILKGSGL